MAKGLTSAQNRFEAIISSTLTTWNENLQRVSDLADAEPIGLDKTYKVVIRGRGRNTAAVSNVTQTFATIEVQLARNLEMGGLHSYDDEGLRKELESDAFSVDENLNNPNNWDFANTGVVLVNVDTSEITDASKEDRRIIWRGTYDLIIRRASSATTI